MTDKIIKESFLLAPFEEEKTSQSDHNRQEVQQVRPLNKLMLNLQKPVNDVKIDMEMESPSPTKRSGGSLISFDIKHHEILKKEDYVVSKLKQKTESLR